MCTKNTRMARAGRSGPGSSSTPVGRDPLTGKIKYKIEKVGEFKKLAERAYQKKMVEWAEKKYLDIKEESNLTFSQLVQWFLELPVVRQNKTIKDIERSCRDLDKVFGPMLIKDIKPAMVETYQQPAATGTDSVWKTQIHRQRQPDHCRVEAHVQLGCPGGAGR